MISEFQSISVLTIKKRTLLYSVRGTEERIKN